MVSEQSAQTVDAVLAAVVCYAYVVRKGLWENAGLAKEKAVRYIQQVLGQPTSGSKKPGGGFL